MIPKKENHPGNSDHFSKNLDHKNFGSKAVAETKFTHEILTIFQHLDHQKEKEFNNKVVAEKIYS